MTVHPWPDHLLDLAEWDALPEDTSRRFELVEGVLLVAPRPTFRHQDLIAGLAAALNAALPGVWRALVEVEVVIDAGQTPTVRAPDVAVVPGAFVDDRSRCAAADLRAVFEVLSPGTVRTDRVAKLHEYAEAGIPLYGILDPGPPPILTEFGLRDGGYERVAEHIGRARLDIDGPVEIDLG